MFFCQLVTLNIYILRVNLQRNTIFEAEVKNIPESDYLAVLNATYDDVIQCELEAGENFAEENDEVN